MTSPALSSFQYSCKSMPIRFVHSLSVAFEGSITISKSRRKQNNVIHLSDQELYDGCRLGMDSHADMSCVGAHASILEVYEGQICNVMPFNDSYTPMKNIRTVNAAFAYDSDDGQTYILQVNQALDFSRSMKHSLLCPNQSRMNGVVIDDCPKALDYHGRSTHSIYFPDSNLRLPLSLKFPTSFLPVRRPSQEELDNCMTLELTSSDHWAPELFDKVAMSAIVEPVIDPIYDLFKVMSSHMQVSTSTLVKRKAVEPSDLAKLWNISLPNAKRTLECTTQDYIRQIDGKLSRRVKTRAHQRQYNQLSGYLGKFCSDTFKSNVSSLRGNSHIQLFCNRGNYVKSFPMKSKGHAHHALDRLLHETGIPNEMLTDGAKELTLAEWGRICTRHKIKQISTEPHNPWQNPAELAGGVIKRKVRHLMRTKAAPVVLWDYCWEYVCEVRNHTATDNIYTDQVTAYEKIHGYSPDISELLVFGWYDWVWYHEPGSSDKKRIGRWLGPSHDVGQGLAYYILSDKGKVKTRSTVSPIQESEMADAATKRMMMDYTASMESVIGNYTKAMQNHSDDRSSEDLYSSMFEDDELDDQDVEPQERDSDGNPLYQPEHDVLNDAPFVEESDKLLGAKIQLPHHSGEALEATVRNRKRTHDGLLVGTSSDNPLMDTRVYEVEFNDGTYTEYAANVLLENLYQQIDDEGRSHSILSSIVNHACNPDEAVSKEDAFYVTKDGVNKRRITSSGWKLEVEWKDGTSSWIPLKLLKESNPVELAEYAKSRGIDKEPAFAWWVNHVLKKRDRIIKQVKHRPVKKSIKFGIQVPSSVEEALRLDKENNNTFWSDAINKELSNVIIAFKLLNEGECPPVGSKRIPYHIIFDVKFDLTRKARLVAGGHRHKEVPSYATYSSVVSRDSVRIVFILAALNDLKIKSADVGNAYLNAPNREKVHVKCGPELFGPESEGQIAVIVRALYGLKSAGNSWRHHFSNYITEELGYQSTVADPDVYRKARVKENGDKYYSYLVVYVDDILCCDVNPSIVMEQIQSTFRLKGGYNDPNLYLGANIRRWKYTSDDGTTQECWAMGSESYVKEAVRVCDNLMDKYGMSYTSTGKHGRKSPFNSHEYRAELETSNYCNHEMVTVFQNLIGILRWICELGRIDIVYEVSILSQYLAQPRIGHLQQALNIFYYLKHHNRSWLVQDPMSFDIEWVPRTEGELSPQERAVAMKELYPDAQEDLLHDMPEPRGREIDINVFVDADHAGNKITRRSHTGIILMCNMAPITWYSKRQNTVETSTFGSEFIALRIAVELVEALRYKLRMFGVPISGPARLFCDNESVVKSSGTPEARLKKKHNSIAYH